jgi:hypothetical protein
MRVVSSCLLDEIFRMVSAEGEEGREIVDGGCVRYSTAAHDKKENIDIGTWPLLANGIGERDLFIANHLCGVGEVVACVVFPFPYLNNL